MSYQEIKERIVKKQEDLIEEERQLNDLNTSIDSLEEQLNSLEDSKKKKLESERQLASELFRSNLERPFDESISTLNSKKIILKDKFESKMSEINEETYRKKLESSINIKEELERCNEIKSITADFYGDEFSTSIKKVIPKSENVTIFSEIPRLRVKSDVLSRSNKFQDLIDKIMTGLDEDGDDAISTHKEKITAVVCILILVLSIVIYPVILTVLIFSIFYNVIKSRFFVECMRSSKAIESNIDELQETLSNKVKEDLARDREILNNKYNDNLAKITSKINDIENSKLIKVEKENKNFDFNPKEIVEGFEIRRSDLFNRLNEVKLQSINKKRVVEELEKDLETLNSELDKSLLTLTDDYMPSELKHNLELPIDYLLDIVDAKPVVLARPKGGSVFLYRDKEDLYTFLNLLFYQTILRTSLEMIKFTLIDIAGIGRVLKEVANDDSLMVIRDMEDVSKFFQSTNEEMKIRFDSMGIYTSLDKYNKYLTENECPPIEYNFILYLDPDLNTLKTDMNKQILLNGNDSGYFEYIFLNNSELNSKNKSLLLETFNSEGIDSFYLITDKVIKRPKQFILDKIEAIE